MLDIPMDAEDSCEAQVKRARTIMGLDMCVLLARDDTYGEAAGTMTNLTETCGVSATGENVAAPEATYEPNQLKTFGGWRGEPTVDDTIPRGYVYSQKTKRSVADSLKNDRAKSRFVAAEVTGDVMDDVHAGTLALKALRTTINLATTRDEKHRLRNSVFYDTTATFVCASIDEVVGISPQGGLLGKKECPLVFKAHHGTRMASKRRQQHYMRMLGTHKWTASKAMLGVFRHRDQAGQCRCRGNGIMADSSDEAVQAGRFSLKGQVGQQRE